MLGKTGRRDGDLRSGGMKWWGMMFLIINDILKLLMLKIAVILEFIRSLWTPQTNDSLDKMGQYGT